MGSYAVPDELGNDLLAAHSVQTTTRPVHAASFSWKAFRTAPDYCGRTYVNKQLRQKPGPLTRISNL